jgi:formylglycine-generating enzyme required for sulfatase activity
MRAVPNAPAFRQFPRLRAGALGALAIFLGTASGRTLHIGADEQSASRPAAAVGRSDSAASGEFDDCAGAAWCPRMVSLASGRFVMGSPPRERGRFDDEAQRSVRVQAFAIAKYPVTRGQWHAFVAATGRSTPDAPCAYARTGHPTWKNTGFPQDDRHPVVCVTWADAQDYARWLSARTGHHYRLLTDPEWEYAARGGTTTPFPWGSAASHEFGNYGKDECCGPMVRGNDRWEFTSPVGSFPPNRFGLYDMHGNVTVWLETCADSAEKLPIPKGAKGCTYRYGRGANYDDYPAMLRSAAKNLAPPPGGPLTIENYRSTGFGIRVARDLDPVPARR